MAELLAKPDIPLIAHLAEVTQLGTQLAHQLDLPRPLLVKALLACTLHDIGKATEDFQEYIRGKCKQAYPHALASLPFVLIAEKQLNQHLELKQTRYEATAAVLTHHSPLGPELYKGFETPPRYHQDIATALQDAWEILASVLVPIGGPDLPSAEKVWQEVQQFLRVSKSPATILDDRGLQFDAEGHTMRGVLRCLSGRDFARVKTVLHLADWLASAKEPRLSVLFLQEGLSAIQHHIQKLKAPLHQFQQRAAEVFTQEILHLRAPTGTGKTEALLLWAGNTERLLYLLPTQATTNAMWQRLQRIYGKEHVGLAHGRASYILHQEAEEDPLDARLFGSVFAKPVTVATLDQYLLAHLHGRHWEERRTLAQRATVVLDEIHAYEPYTLGLLLEALERERPARLALASATLPEPLRELFPQGTLVEAEPKLWKRRRHRLELQDGMLLKEGVEQALAFAHRRKSVLVVANTIRDAQAFYERLKEVGCERQELLHGRFILRDRQAKEAKVSSPEPGMIFVATQVVEVSLDISYDVLLTEIAPVDALVQRMGRVNRRGEKPPAPVQLYIQWSEGSRRVYGKDMLEWSARILAQLPSEPTDAELADATQELYTRVVRTNDWQKELDEGRQTLREVQQILRCYTIDLSDEELRERFKSRRGVVSVEVLPAQFVEEAYKLKERHEGWRLPELLVPVPIWWFKQSVKHFSPVTDLGVFQTALTYDPQLGLRLSPDQEQLLGII